MWPKRNKNHIKGISTENNWFKFGTIYLNLKMNFKGHRGNVLGIVGGKGSSHKKRSKSHEELGMVLDTRLTYTLLKYTRPVQNDESHSGCKLKWCL